MSSIKLIKSAKQEAWWFPLVEARRKKREIRNITKAMFVHRMLIARFGSKEGKARLNNTKWKVFLGSGSYAIYKKYKLEQTKNLKRK